MKLENGSKLVMIGDSVTDCERAHPLGEGLFGGIGKGYPALVAGLLEATYPERRIRVINMGTSGNTVRDLKARWETDVMALEPDWLSVMIGINDVWRQFDSQRITEQHVYLEEYTKTLDGLIGVSLKKIKNIVLMTPYYMEPNKGDEMRAAMDKYGAAVKDLAQKYGTLFVDTQAAFDRLLKHCHSSNLAWDRVHPNITGHMVIARAFLDAVGYSWEG